MDHSHPLLCYIRALLERTQGNARLLAAAPVAPADGRDRAPDTTTTTTTPVLRTAVAAASNQGSLRLSMAHLKRPETTTRGFALCVCTPSLK